MDPTTLVSHHLGRQMQVAFVVRDLDAALRHWITDLRIGPFVIFERNAGDRRILFRGQPTSMDMSLAFSYVGDTQIEIIQQLNDAPSPYKEFTDAGRQGLHHVAFWPDDYPEACRGLEHAGYEEICSMSMADGTKNVSYYASPPHIGTVVELVPATAARKRYFGLIRRMVEEWDGSDPVRRFRTRDAFLARHRDQL